MAFNLLSRCARLAKGITTPFNNKTTSLITSSFAKRQLTFEVESNLEFEEKVLNATKPVIVDFYASWCGPCKQLTPLLTGVVDAMDDKIDLAKVDVDELEDIAMEYNVRSIPTVLAMKGGKVVNNFTGSRDSVFLETFVGDLVEE